MLVEHRIISRPGADVDAIIVGLYRRTMEVEAADKRPIRPVKVRERTDTPCAKGTDTYIAVEFTQARKRERHDFAAWYASAA